MKALAKILVFEHPYSGDKALYFDHSVLVVESQLSVLFYVRFLHLSNRYSANSQTREHALARMERFGSRKSLLCGVVDVPYIFVTLR